MRRLLTPRWLARHLLMVCLVAGCLGLGWWQLSRAESGNLLSYGYAVEWPIFAGFVVFIWYREIRVSGRPGDSDAREPGIVDAPGDGLGPLRRVPAPARIRVETVGDDPQLREYNDYLAWLAEDPSRQPADYPGTPAADGG